MTKKSICLLIVGKKSLNFNLQNKLVALKEQTTEKKRNDKNCQVFINARRKRMHKIVRLLFAEKSTKLGVHLAPAAGILFLKRHISTLAPPFVVDLIPLVGMVDLTSLD